MADMGFDTIKVRGATMIWDEVVPDMYTGTAAISKGTVFFINTNFYKLVIDTETDIITTPLKRQAEYKPCELLETPNVEPRAISIQAYADDYEYRLAA